MTKSQSAPRVAALVGPYLSGKTALFEAILASAGAINRKGNAKEGYLVGDGAPEAKSRAMSTELTAATAEYLGEKWTFLDCPGSIELAQETYNALMVVDAAVVVCEPETDKALTVAPLLRFLDDHAIPHIIFVNKMDSASLGVKVTLEALQEVSERPLVLREIPMRDGNDMSGHVDLVSERAFQWRDGKASDLVQIPDDLQSREAGARAEMLETLADFDDKLLEELLEDVAPSTDEIYDNLTRDFRADRIVPVFFGSAEHDNGISRVLKALRHETPESSLAAERLGISGGEATAQVFKTQHAGHTGKLSVARVFGGEMKDGASLGASRISGLYALNGQKHDKLAKVGDGEIAALGRLDGVATGDQLSASACGAAKTWPDTLSPLFSASIHAAQRSDEVKLTGALGKLIEEDPSLSVEQHQESGELLLWGQGEMHLLIALDRLKNRFNMQVTSERPQVPYKETIRKAKNQHARHKKQSGGHGQFGDIHLEIKPLPRGAGFNFDDSITGGVVPKQYIPAVEHGIQEYMRCGPLGFPVVDIAVTLTDGQHHSVDSSDMAFKAAAQLGMREAMPDCGPILLEPICKVDISVPNNFTSKIQRLVNGRRGHILGFDAKDGWKGWDEVSVQLPQSEMHDLINELRSMTLGVGTFSWAFDHLQEFSGKQADQVVAAKAG
ncbi:MAG: elongation factor G [Rhodospirillaceae bacterium]|jgi:elongation factor G|nr:elongation factor G [Rhodospirillaceae bacterium]MBT4219272.1 elongation factor G [Rhodospirillaceae bacterium]MBT4464054.1 elongation factor G [Rhodospirillaceae bacterium]MBT5014767.1 elongation factor G [Rhodospirillaceae bacterium]MBT5309303.1 elongation factor G [Rhodospirillaceae bacterium]